MVKVQFPFPHEVEYTRKGTRKPIRTLVEDWRTLEFVETSEVEAPVVAKFDMDFPDGAFANEWTYGKCDLAYERPKTEVRTFDGKYYVPLYEVDETLRTLGGKLNPVAEFAPSRVGIDNFTQSFGTKSREFMCVFSELPGLPRDGDWRDVTLVEHIERQMSEALPTAALLAETGSVKNVDGLWMLETLAEMLTDEIVFIGDNAWVQTKEPVLLLKTSYQSATVDIVPLPEVRTVEENNRHIFRLDRLDDLEAHVRDNFPKNELYVRFGDLDVILPNALVFEDEVEPIHEAAKWAATETSYDVRNMTAGQGDAWYVLRDVVAEFPDSDEWNVESGEKVASALEAFVTATDAGLGMKGQHQAKAAVERWKWRPVRADQSYTLG